jgi:hypothetical protein
MWRSEVEVAEVKTTLDVETDGGGRIILTITRNGALSVQSYSGCSKGRPLWGMSGSALVAPADLKDWADTLHEMLRSNRTPAPAPGQGEVLLPLPDPPQGTAKAG